LSSLLACTVTFDLLQMDLPGATNRMGCVFFSLALFGFTSLSIIDGLMLEREVVRREVAGGYYRPWTYLLTKLLLDGLLLRALPAAAFTALMYPLVRWRPHLPGMQWRRLLPVISVGLCVAVCTQHHGIHAIIYAPTPGSQQRRISSCPPRC
jgi:hypothetical protein